MFWDWLHRIIYRRQISKEWDEIVAMGARQEAMRAYLDSRIRENFTPAEWADTRARCEKKLAESGY